MSEDLESASDAVISGPQIIGILCLGVLCLAVIIMLIWIFGNGEWQVYFRDPAAVYDFSPLAGFVSHLGVFLLVVSGVIGIFASLHARRDRRLLLFVGSFSILLATDDFFMLHEEVFPRALGVAESYTYAVYALIGVLILALNARTLLGLRHIGLYASLALLTMSIVFDFIEGSSNTAEDSFKFLGFLMWCCYWSVRAHRAL